MPVRKLLKKYAVAPERLVTDDLRSSSAAACIAGDAVPVSARGEGGKQPFALNPCGFRKNLLARVRH
jgi:hypothetical protein